MGRHSLPGLAFRTLTFRRYFQMLNVSIPQPSDFLLKPKPFIKMNTPQENARHCLCRYVATRISFLSHMRAFARGEELKSSYDPGRNLHFAASPAREKSKIFSVAIGSFI